MKTTQGAYLKETLFTFTFKLPYLILRLGAFQGNKLNLDLRDGTLMFKALSYVLYTKKYPYIFKFSINSVVNFFFQQEACLPFPQIYHHISPNHHSTKWTMDLEKNCIFKLHNPFFCEIILKTVVCFCMQRCILLSEHFEI